MDNGRRGTGGHGAVDLVRVPAWRRRSWARRACPALYMRDRGVDERIVRMVCAEVQAPLS